MHQKWIEPLKSNKNEPSIATMIKTELKHSNEESF